MDSEKYSSEVDLNAFFLSMSEVKQEETDWKQHIQFIMSKVPLLSEMAANKPYNPVELAVYGSSAEDLKLCLPNDIGDIDIMVYPAVAEEATIDDSVIESVDGINPIFARLRGKHHPVLRHCLAENSDFVATSSLKEFHPKLFGGMTNTLNLFPKIFSRIHELDMGNIASGVVNEPGGPSLQLDLMHSYGNPNDQVKEEGQEWGYIIESGDFRNFLEWFAVAVNPSREFTEEHSACIDDRLKVTQDKIQMFKEDPSVEKHYSTLNELMLGERFYEIKQKVLDIDQRLAKENCGSNALSDDGSKPIDSNASMDSKDESKKSELSTVSSPSETENDSKTKLHLSTPSQDLADPQNINLETKMMQTDQDSEPTQGLPLPTPDDNNLQHAISEAQKKLEIQLINSLFGDTVPFSSSMTAKLEHPNKSIQSGIDLVPAFKVRGWPRAASAWPTRLGRAWPSQDIISKILDSDFHMVVKSPPNTDQENTFFRLSFSRAELILSGELNDVQRECYRCLKIFYHLVIQEREPKIINSYFLKTILFWTVEETGLEFWKETNRGACVLMLLERLYKALESNCIPHYFIPEFNLLEEAVLNHAEEVKFISNEFRKIYENPIAYHNIKKDEKMTDTKSSLIEEPSLDLQSEAGKKYNAQSVDKISSKSSNASDEVSIKEDVGKKTTKLFLKYTEFQKIYKEICRELIDMVLEEDSSHQEDPIVKCIVENLRLVSSTMRNPEAELMTVLGHDTQGMYTSHVMHPGNSPRQRILSSLKGQSKMFAYVVAQDDLLEEGKEHLIVDRMMNSDTFDTSSLLPDCWDFVKQCMSLFNHPPTPSTTESVFDDIPLD